MTTPAGTIRVARDGARGWHFIAQAKYDASPEAFTVLDDDLKPVEGASDAPDGVPTPIPDDWETLHHMKAIALAKELAGDFEPSEGQSMTDKARAIIAAAVADRANPPVA